MDQPEVHDAIMAMRRVADEYPDRVMIGEAYLPIDRLMAYYGVDLTGFHLPFNFHLLSTPWQPVAIAALIEAYEAALPPGGWPQGKRMKVCDPIAGALSGRSQAPKPCRTQKGAGSEDRLLTYLRDR